MTDPLKTKLELVVKEYNKIQDKKHLQYYWEDLEKKLTDDMELDGLIYYIESYTIVYKFYNDCLKFHKGNKYNAYVDVKYLTSPLRNSPTSKQYLRW